MKCVVCGQLTDAAAAAERQISQLHLACANYKEAADLLIQQRAARDAVWRWAVKESWHGITHWEGCPCAALHKLMEGSDAQKP